MVIFRKAEQQDAGKIRALIFRVGINPAGLDWRRFLVAVDETGQIVGCGQIKPHGDGTRELSSIAVLPGRQKEGIGTAIVNRLLAENELPLYLTCMARLQPYYEKFGFRTLGEEEMPPYYRRIYRIFRFFKTIFRRMEGFRVMVKE